MKVKEILKYLNTEYILIANDKNEYFIEYLTMDDLSNEIKDSDLKSIEPVVAIKKSLFVNNAGPNDYVTALKIITTNQPIMEEETIEVDEIFENEEERQRAKAKEKEREQQTKGPNTTNPFGGFGNFGGLGDFGNLFGPDTISSLLTPELMEKITNSEQFKQMMTPENINEILNSEDFKNFMSNVNISDILGSMGNFNSNVPTEEETSDEDEYEEI